MLYVRVQRVLDLSRNVLYRCCVSGFKQYRIKSRQISALALTLFMLVVPQSELSLVKVKGQTVLLGFELCSETQLQHSSYILTRKARGTRAALRGKPFVSGNVT